MDVIVNGVDVSATYQDSELEGIQVRLVADKGEVGEGSMPLPDAAGSREDYSGQSVLLKVGSDVILDGFLGATERDRNEIAGGPRLVNAHHMGDDNALLDGFVALKWKRPAETDRARILAFADAFLPGSIDTTWVLNTHTQTVPKKTYDTESLYSELQDDLGKATGKTLFIERRRLHWHLPTEGIVSLISVVEAEDADYVNSYPLLSRNAPIRSKDPIDLTTKVYAQNSHGTVKTATDSGAVARHDAAGVKHQKLADGGDAGSTLLQTIADNTLNDNKAERITYEGEIGPLTAAQLADIPVGALINVTDHVWGLSSSTQRIGAENIRYTHPDHFFIGLELGYPIRIRAKPPATTPAPGTGHDGGVLPPFVCDLVDYTVPTCDGDPGADLPTGVITGLEGGSFPGEDTETVALYHGATYRFRFTAIHATTNFECNLNGAVGGGGFIRMTFGNLGPMPSPIPPLTEITVDATYVSGGGAGTFECNSFNLYTGAGYAGCNCVGASGTMTVTYLSGPDPRYEGLGLCANGEPFPGQLVEDESVQTGDGVTTHYTTLFPYEAESLRIEVNGRDWTSVLTETDPDAGTYDLAYPPPIGSTVIVTYKGSH
jgi:hypothetical protein